MPSSICLQPRSADNLRPLPDVVLRHAAGLLFQEAHYEAVVFDQRQLSLYPVLPPQARLGTRERTSVGVYFTPPAIARTLCEEARRHVPSNARSLTIFDPACGSGEFLREALRQLRLAEFTGDIRVLGWDISAAAVSMARFALNWETRMLTGKATATIEQRDSLDQRPWPASDIVLMNPPFVSWLDLPKDRAQQLKALLDGLTSHRPDLASVFLWRGIQSLTPQGVLGAVLPASLLDGESVRDLRHAVAERAIPTLIAKLGSHHLFHGAAVDTALFVAAKQPQTDPALVWADYRSSSSSAALRSLRRYRAMAPPSIPIEGLGFSVYGTQPIAGVDKWVPRPYQSWRRLQQVSASTVVGDLFAVRQGVLTGLNKVFVLPRATFFQLPEAERAFFRPATTNASIDVGRIVENAYVFYPYTEGGILRVATLATVRRHLPFYYREFIKPNEARLKARSLLDRQWWEPLKPRLTWQPPLVPRLLSVYFGGPGCFAFDESGRFACVQGYAWSWRRAPSLPIALGYAYSALLASSIVGDLLGMVSSHTGGGQWNLSRRFLTDMPLPDLAQTAHEVVSGLTQVGRSLATGQPVPQKGIDELAAVAYGVVST